VDVTDGVLQGGRIRNGRGAARSASPAQTIARLRASRPPRQRHPVTSGAPKRRISRSKPSRMGVGPSAIADPKPEQRDASITRIYSGITWSASRRADSASK
jgi:hypothetical protein